MPSASGRDLVTHQTILELFDGWGDRRETHAFVRHGFDARPQSVPSCGKKRHAALLYDERGLPSLSWACRR
jgi:hypothetical protein